MGSLFTVTICGFVGGTVSVREVGEQRVASFSVAANRKTRNGDQQTIWVRVNCWNGLSEVAERYLQSGSQVLITASWMRTSAYIDRDGNPQSSIDINADRLVLLDRVNDDAPTNDLQNMADVPF